ncbi:MAG TPA: AbrB/MazE/SpoVT family DNA-binding domain-containing protein [Verrucomicrobiae bacterium]|nr:AbrB/MazE/SpoVT family DNA-binding domain-containing protein [Verrucomicrobiae bacterium]
MTTTIALTSKNQCTIPKAFVEAAGLKPETQLRVTQVGKGLYITPIPEPTEREFRAVLKLADTGKRFGKEESRLLGGTIKKHRAKNKSRS